MADFSTNETLNLYFETGDAPTSDQLQAFIKSKVGILLTVEALPTAASTNLGQKYLIGTTLYTCILTDTTYSWQAQVWGGGVTAYTDLSAKPKINSIELNGDKTAAQLGLLPSATTGMTALSTLGNDNLFYVKVGSTWYYVTYSVMKALILADAMPVFLYGTTVTGTGTGVIFTVADSKINDMYINTSTYNLYKCSDTDTWDYLCNLKGVAGDNAEIFFGTAVTGTGTDIAATVEGSKAGDYYKNTTTSFYYQATAANVWDYKGSDKGADGTDVLSATDVSSLTAAGKVYCEADGVVHKITLANLKTSLASIQ